ncbi:hypothetical protein A3I27_01120 [Candidatus Giovannonibacteria bacterium RIFCSPLOWO2_02_FULL_43_11b]|uniref:Capsule synthesis protein CapA domain-containing protein n=1 Tax=Candidatus Giovannonibacteria bacterium RIFCSPHIGHO2_12_FULL_43_15 TaxID=1798341 RepID=A0A1F5WRV4_9BACT|nr:MAG: hypothetical protein A2739_00275 [Candidatus Giovannonibacteria bacterium RIFCSPHIGHO2_01_FULL_43_100]OGF67468.1 MAG: hypothetical protein A3B97_01725 [Candidatus Giovannonibacteria bacterium RIFCSPHIGHO2_02_FULL_43_32]OGF78344.1 MAG: hypothetical protein A3F23_01280 [Candidatus Giovannonibacteria bacterium RIFCSPHIGHO2_12_FULL_43_15]OGF78964.1 MAG: hypothetical protein A3A15_01785 [Candidatus Giovannonibacteria bacterium RIFCSPLOWO2_01_FULL_43_60]OGF90632.1 MAG: hypothetical protein A3
MRYILIAILAIVSILAGKIYFNPPEIYNAEKLFEEKNLKFAFVGDIMLDRDVEKKILKEGAGDFRFPFLNIADKLSGYDFLFGNLEGPVSVDEGINSGSAISFRFDPRVLEGLEFAGFDALSVANNHSGDRGGKVFRDTLLNLESAGIKAVGASLEPVVFDFESLRVEIVGFADFPGPGARATAANIVEALGKARSKADIVIASFHFGEEYHPEPSERQRELAQLAVDSGADLVIGHHPHVSQSLEKYKDAYIAYSLGNFIFDQYFSEETMRGALLEVEIKDGKISGVKTREIKLNSNYQPSLVD